MRRLILFRHAKTEPRAPGGDDIDRALVERGRLDAVRMGRVLAREGLAPDLALVSPAARARETWELACPAFPGVRVEIRAGLYNATPEEVAAELDEPTVRADTVMVVGHNPSLQELAVAMMVEGSGSALDIERLAAGFPTATAAAFAIDEAGRATLDAVFHVRDYRELDA